MRCQLSFVAAILTIAASLFTAPLYAHADAYQVFDLGGANARTIYGIDTVGTVVVYDGACPASKSYICYLTYSDGVAAPGFLLAPPSLTYDNGTPCTPSVPSGTTVFHADCNNGREVLGAFFSSPLKEGVFLGPDPVADYFHSGTADKIALNASGDFAWTDGLDEELFEAVDLTTAPAPEPNSLLLLATGVLAGAEVLRRRWTSSI